MYIHTYKCVYVRLIVGGFVSSIELALCVCGRIGVNRICVILTIFACICMSMSVGVCVYVYVLPCVY